MSVCGEGGCERVGGEERGGGKKMTDFCFLRVCVCVRFLQCFFSHFLSHAHTFLKLRVRDSPMAKNEVSGY